MSNGSKNELSSLQQLLHEIFKHIPPTTRLAKNNKLAVNRSVYHNFK